MKNLLHYNYWKSFIINNLHLFSKGFGKYLNLKRRTIGADYEFRCHVYLQSIKKISTWANFFLHESQNILSVKGHTRTTKVQFLALHRRVPSIPLCLGALSKHFLNSGRLWCCDHCSGDTVPVPNDPLGEEPFPEIQCKPPLTQLQAVPSGHFNDHCRE